MAWRFIRSYETDLVVTSRLEVQGEFVHSGVGSSLTGFSSSLSSHELRLDVISTSLTSAGGGGGGITPAYSSVIVDIVDTVNSLNELLTPLYNMGVLIDNTTGAVHNPDFPDDINWPPDS